MGLSNGKIQIVIRLTKYLSWDYSAIKHLITNY